MALQELNREAMIGIVAEAFGSKSREEGRREALRLRKEQRIAFLGIADELLQEHGYDRVEEGSPQRLTHPVDLLVDDHIETYYTVQLQVARTFIACGPNGEDKTRFTEILTTDPSTEEEYSLFSIEENSDERTRSGETSPFRVDRNTIIRNQYGTVASNQEVSRGLR